MITTSTAISSLCPTAKFTINADDYDQLQWHSDDITKPTLSQINAKITELDISKRKIKLSVKAAQIDEEKSLVAKFGEGATKSGATLKGIFEKAIGKKTKKDITRFVALLEKMVLTLKLAKMII